MSESRMLCTCCKITCSRPWSLLRSARRKRTPSKPHRGRRPASGRKRRSDYMNKKAKKLRKPRRIRSRKPKRWRSMRRTVTMRAESLATTEADFCGRRRRRRSGTTMRSLPNDAVRIATRKKKKSTCTRWSAHKAQGSVCYSMARESEEWWFDVRQKRALFREL